MNALRSAVNMSLIKREEKRLAQSLQEGASKRCTDGHSHCNIITLTDLSRWICFPLEIDACTYMHETSLDRTAVVAKQSDLVNHARPLEYFFSHW